MPRLSRVQRSLPAPMGQTGHKLVAYPSIRAFFTFDRKKHLDRRIWRSTLVSEFAVDPPA